VGSRRVHLFSTIASVSLPPADLPAGSSRTFRPEPFEARRADFSIGLESGVTLSAGFAKGVPIRSHSLGHRQRDG